MKFSSPLNGVTITPSGTFTVAGSVSVIPTGAVVLDKQGTFAAGVALPAGNTSFGPYNVSDFGAVLLMIITQPTGVNPAPVNVLLEWGGAGGPYTVGFSKNGDPHGTGGQSFPTFAFYPVRNNSLTIVCDNLGPGAGEVAFTLIGLPDTNYSAADLPIISNVSNGQIFLDQLAGVANFTIGANTAIPVAPSAVFTGKATLWLRNTNANPIEAFLEVWNGSAWEFFASIAVASGANLEPGLALPLSDWRLLLENNNAGAIPGIYAAVTAERVGLTS